MQGSGVGEHEALRERRRLGVAVAQAGDAVVQQPPTGPQGCGQTAHRSRCSRCRRARPCRCWPPRRSPPLQRVAVVGHAKLDPVRDPGGGRALARKRRLRLGQRDAGDMDIVLAGRVNRKASHPLPTSRTRSPGSARASCIPAPAWSPEPPRGARAAREDRAGVGHGFVQEQGEELVRHVVVVAHRAPVAHVAVAPPAGRSSAALCVAARAGLRREPQRRPIAAGPRVSIQAAASCPAGPAPHRCHRPRRLP